MERGGCPGPADGRGPSVPTFRGVLASRIVPHQRGPDLRYFLRLLGRRSVDGPYAHNPGRSRRY